MKNISKTAVFYSFLAATLAIYVINAEYPNIGIDYAYIIPRLLETKLYYLKNGIEIQWYTPYYGGGIPSYPNGNNAQFSIPQFLMFIFPPWISICIFIFIYIIFEFYFSYKLGLEVFGLSKNNAIVFAALFTTTGYQFQHILLGHLFFNAFSLFPVLFYLIMSKEKFLFKSVVAGLLMALILYSAGFYMLFLFFCILPIIILVKLLFDDGIEVLKFLQGVLGRVIVSLFVFVVVGASKLNASLTFLKFFPREVIRIYGKDLFDSIYIVFLELFYFPFMIFFKKSEEINGFLSGFMNGGTGLHEIDFGISPLFFIIIICVLIGAHRMRIRTEWKKKIVMKLFYVFAIILLFVVFFPLTTTYGPYYLEFKKLPFIKSFSAHERFSPIYGIPIILLVMLFFNSAFPNVKAWKTHLFTLAILGLFFKGYKEANHMYGRVQHLRPLVGHTNDVNKLINEKYDSLQVTSISDKWDDWAILYSFSVGVHLYEPAFGYDLSDFKPQFKLGSVYDIENGYYNMTNPASILFPEENNLKMWERIKIEDKENFELFIHNRTTKWKISKTQEIANVLSLLGLVSSLTFVLIFYILSKFSREKHNFIIRLMIK